MNLSFWSSFGKRVFFNFGVRDKKILGVVVVEEDGRVRGFVDVYILTPPTAPANAALDLTSSRISC